jgi:hypothetical protein
LFGGIAGGDSDTMTWFVGRKGGPLFLPPLIIGGRLYYNIPDSIAYGFKCVDLYTGETIWTKGTPEDPAPLINLGQVVHHWSVAQAGIWSHLWDTSGSTWSMYNAFSGTWLCDIENVSAGSTYLEEYGPTTIFGPNGELLNYKLDGANDRLLMWNSSKLLIPHMPQTGADINYRFDRMSPRELDWNEGIQWNVSILDVPGNDRVAGIDGNVLLAYHNFPPDEDRAYWIQQQVGYSLKSGQEGQQLWLINRTVVDEWAGLNWARNIGEGIFTYFAKDTLTWLGYDVNTGQQIWETEPYDDPFGIFGNREVNIVNGKLYTPGYHGKVTAYDIQTGETVWQWYAGSAGLETPYGSQPLHGSYTGLRFADGKVYALTSEHTPMETPFRGGNVYCIDAETGEEIWRLMATQAEAQPAAIAYGYLVYMSGYDGLIYCIGKGPTKTTVTAPKLEIMHGQTIMIEGMVTDQSPGQPDTPCISDDDMGPWMQYLHMNQPIPSNAQGVEVSLDVIDSNGNFRNIGTATSDISGVYSYAWEPDIPGQYTLIATFAGSESYGSSFAQTAFFVEEVPAPTPPPEATPAPMTDTYLAGSTIAIVAAILIIGFLILRKK